MDNSKINKQTNKQRKSHLKTNIYQARRKWGAGGALTPPVFGQTVNPISTRGADYTHHSTTSPPGFSEFATALKPTTKRNSKKNHPKELTKIKRL